MDNAKLQQTRELYCFDGFRLDTADRRLWFADAPVALKPKQFDLLFYFVRNAGRTATKNELLDAVWADTFVEETTLARNVSWLRDTLGKYAKKESIIETVPKLGYRFTPPVTISDSEEETIIVEKQTIRYFRGEETIKIEDEAQKLTSSRRKLSATTLLFIGIFFVALIGGGSVLYKNYFKTAASTHSLSENKNEAIKNVPADANPIKIGSIVNLQNRYPNDGGYLDAWGMVWSKPEFAALRTQTKFVSTHYNSNRDNGSGSWEILSANGKSNGESLVVGDRIHLKNRFPNAGYLDACGWVEHLPVFKDFPDQTGVVFTTKSPDRDNGTGVWIVRSAVESDGNPVLEGDSIGIESSFSIDDKGKFRRGGFLSVAGNVKDLPAFNDYDGATLVFTQDRPSDQPILDIWTITISKAVLK